ncbi:Protein transport protein S9 plasma membrane t-SNARE [Ascosphaera acerosa]|nr:Protein transport protein S9 plasma membrane t-SNARE [Ascosphaera acerosa]
MGLFSRHKDKKEKDGSPAVTPYSSNPYAVGSQPLDPYSQEKARLAAKANEQAKGGGQQQGGGGGGQRPGYSPGQTATSGYGHSPYSSSQTRPSPGGGGSGGREGSGGGYGGLGSSDPNDTESRNALFGDAKQRHQESQANMGKPGYEGGAAAGSHDQPPEYKPYEERQLTAEEEEEEDVQATKQEIRFLKEKTVSSTRNAMAAAARAEETGRDTLTRLGVQGERLHDTDKNLNVAENENRIAQDKARELSRVNRSMFAAVHVGNPFTSESRRRKHEQDILDRHQEERYARESARADDYRSTQRMNQHFKDVNKSGKPGAAASNTVERGKYQFEADSEDEAMEDEIEQNINHLEGASGRLNALAKATGQELSNQNQLLDRIGSKSDRVDDQLRLNRDRLDRIR